jgi:predicted RND superfamily exporter protein
MGRSSRNSDAKVSFFAFQDIITAVIGILVLIALILALQINPKRENEGESPGNNTAPVELIEGDKDGGGNATIVVVSEFNASEVIEEIAQLHQEISDEKREFLVKRDEKNSEIEELLKELKRVNMELQIFKKKLGIVDSNESKDMNKALKSLQLILDLAKVQQKELDEKKKGLEDQVNARILRNISDMSELELQELDSQLNSQIEQLTNQVENEVRVIPKENRVGEKPVLVILGAAEFTIGIFNGAQRTVQVTPATYYQQLGSALNSYDKKRNFFVYFFRPSACEVEVTNVPGRNGMIKKNLFALLCDPKNNLTRMLGFKYGFEPIHEEAAVLFTDKTPDVFEDLFISP